MASCRYMYYKQEEKQGSSLLLDPSTIQAANTVVKRILEDEELDCNQHPTHGQCETLSAIKKATIARCAAEMGETKDLRKLQNHYLRRQLDHEADHKYFICEIFANAHFFFANAHHLLRGTCPTEYMPDDAQPSSSPQQCNASLV